jgi:hypothetical protein
LILLVPLFRLGSNLVYTDCPRRAVQERVTPTHPAGDGHGKSVTLASDIEMLVGNSGAVAALYHALEPHRERLPEKNKGASPVPARAGGQKQVVDLAPTARVRVNIDRAMK